MHKLFLLPAAALLLAGCDFSGGDESVTAPIANIQVADIAADNDPDGSAPDVFVEIQNSTGRSLYRSAVQNDADLASGLSVSISDAVEIPSATMPLRIAVYTSGADLANARRLAQSAFFSLPEIEADADGEVMIASDGGPARFTVTRSAQ